MIDVALRTYEIGRIARVVDGGCPMAPPNRHRDTSSQTKWREDGPTRVGKYISHRYLVSLSEHQTVTRQSGRPGPIGRTETSAESGLYQSRFVGEDHGLDTVAASKLMQDPGEVGLGSPFADVQRVGDLGVGESTRDQL